ncbi:uncharacterized protein LOC129738105 [Uranotaenia lowii]|uniref:uncharacterized protein LOC129738105 n=1 Tax=Uranotaenia lowii TaxID=190385 RepID=UPI0024783821|nr:uncharacterized protein LOC129738105 [Uranotaenia lowii]
MIDDRLIFTSHVDYVCKRAAVATAALTRMSSSSAFRTAAGRQALRRLCNLQRLSSVQRLMNLRVISEYRTISTEAANVVAGVMPISVLLEEDVYCYDNKDAPNVRDLAYEDSMSNWL